MESEQRKQRLAEIRAAFEMSHVESPCPWHPRCDAAHKDLRGCCVQPTGPVPGPGPRNQPRKGWR
jgi:hypothetical protein